MNSELKLITDQIAEISQKALAKNGATNSQQELTKVRELIANYVTILTGKIPAEGVKDLLSDPQNNILHIAAKFGADAQLLAVLQFVVNLDLSNSGFGKTSDGRDAKYYANLRDHNHFTPLHHAAKNGWSEAVKVLLEYGAETAPKAAPKDRAWVPMHYAAKGGHLDVIKVLLAARADKEVKTSFGLTPLVVAAEFGHLNVLQFLLEQKAERNVKTTTENYSMTALHYAAVGGFADVTIALIKAGIDKEIKTTSGLTALHFAVSVAAVDVINILLSSGANTKVVDDSGHDLLSFAVLKGKKDSVATLLKWGIGDLNDALKLAEANSSREIISQLEVYQEAIKGLFALKNLPDDMTSTLKSFTKENLVEDKIILKGGASFNGYGIVFVRREVGLFGKIKVSLVEAANKAGNDSLADDLVRLEKLAGLYQS